MDAPRIMGTWTDEYLDLMIRKLTERKTREREPSRDPEGVSVDALAAASNGMIEVKR